MPLQAALRSSIRVARPCAERKAGWPDRRSPRSTLKSAVQPFSPRIPPTTGADPTRPRAQHLAPRRSAREPDAPGRSRRTQPPGPHHPAPVALKDPRLHPSAAAPHPHDALERPPAVARDALAPAVEVHAPDEPGPAAHDAHSRAVPAEPADVQPQPW